MASNRRGLPEINAGSMADIAFLLLIFFLVTTTMDQDTGIARKLPPMPEEQQETPPEINARNIFQVVASPRQGDKVMVNDDYENLVPISELRDMAKKFINNNGKLSSYSENPDKAIVSLVTTNSLQYNTYILIQNELAAAYTELRNEASLNKFGQRYNDLSGAQLKEIKKMYPQKISEAEPQTIEK